jgi:hypothetical protein
MGKKKKKKKKKLEEQPQFSDKFSLERIMLIVVSVLLIFAVGYIAISSLTKSDGDEPASVASGDSQDIQDSQDSEDAEEVSEDAGVSEDAASGGDSGAATPTPKRLELEPTNTPSDPISEDDPRSLLDLNIPFETSSFDEPVWYEYDTENATYELKDGQLIGVDHEPEERNTYYSETRIREIANVYVEVSATNGDCIGKDSVGVVIRIDADSLPSGYTFEISCDGSYRLRNLHSSPQKGTLINWTPSDVINSGAFATNRIGFWGYWGKFYLFVNNQLIDETFDSSYSAGGDGFAVFVRASQTFDLSATFDDFAIWAIPFH